MVPGANLSSNFLIRAIEDHWGSFYALGYIRPPLQGEKALGCELVAGAAPAVMIDLHPFFSPERTVLTFRVGISYNSVHLKYMSPTRNPDNRESA